METNISKIEVLWNPQLQRVGLKFDTTEFKTWEWVLMVLEGAKREADTRLRESILAAIQQQAMMAKQEQAVVNGIIRPR